METFTIALLSVSLLVSLLGHSLQNPERQKEELYRAHNRQERMAESKEASADFKDAVSKVRIYQKNAESIQAMGRLLGWIGLWVNLTALIVALFEWKNRTNQPSALTGSGRPQA